MIYFLTAGLVGFVIGIIAAEIWDCYKFFRIGVLEVRMCVKNSETYRAFKVESQTRVYLNDDGKRTWLHRGRLHELNKPKYEEYR